jgi:hypothetical protein
LVTAACCASREAHPLAERRQQQLEGPNLTQSEHQDAARLGAPFKIVDSDISPFRLEVARRIAAMNSAAGLPADAPLPAADRARVRTEIAREFPHNRRLARIRAKVVEASASRRMAALATSR